MSAPMTLGIDFGTSNSAAGVAVNGQPWLIELEPGEKTLPTAVFFEADKGRMQIGSRATRALINGEDGRFMRALKSLLGTPMIGEERRLGNERISFQTVIARFLAEIKARAEAATHMRFTHALSGRPVRFHSRDDARNAQAERDLRACYLEAGFEDVTFVYEPEAALHASAAAPGYGLIVDIGGGTSDFTAYHKVEAGEVRILASHGIRLGGTDFDRLVSLDRVMPLLGRDSQIKNSFGGGTLPAPNRIFTDLATWQMIPFLYTPDQRRAATDLARNAVEPARLNRLVQALEDELGHDIAFAVERGKIGANSADREGEMAINLGILERGLTAALSGVQLNRILEPSVAEMIEAAQETLAQADLRQSEVTQITLVGGSSLLYNLQAALGLLCPNADLRGENALTAVADGLALMSAGQS